MRGLSSEPVNLGMVAVGEKGRWGSKMIAVLQTGRAHMSLHIVLAGHGEGSTPKSYPISVLVSPQLCS